MKPQPRAQTLLKVSLPRNPKERFKMSDFHQVIFVFSLLLLASSQGLDLRHQFSSAPHGEAEDMTNSPSPWEINNGEVLFTNGIRWDILPEASPNSSSSRLIPEDVHCEKEGLNAVAGSCQTFVYCKDLSNEGLEDWYILLFTCPEGHVFKEASGKCEHHYEVDEHRECKPETELGILGEQDLTKQDILTISNYTGKETHPGTVKFLEQNDKEDNYDAYIDWEVSGKSELTIKRKERSGNAHQEIKPLIPKFSNSNNSSVSEKTLDFFGEKYFQVRKKRSASSIQPRGKAADIIAQNAREACQNIKSINKYVNHIINHRPFQSAYPTENSFMSIIEAYNQNLKVAQMNTKPWNEETGILKSVIEIFNLAKEFEPKFKNQFSNIDENVALLLKKYKVYGTDERINSLLKRIKEAEAIIKLSESPFVSEYLKHSITEAKSELANILPTNLIGILDSVLSNSIEIQTKSSNTVRRMEVFRQNIIQDHSKFILSISKAQEGTIRAEREREQTLLDISDHKKTKQASEREIQENKRQIIEFEEEHQRVESSLQREMRELDRRAKEANDLAIAGGFLLAFPILGTIVGAVLLGIGIEDKERALRMKSQAKTELERQMKILKDITAVLNNRVASEERIINSLTSKITSLERRSHSLQVIRGILQNMEKSASSVKNSITKAMSTIVSLTNVFSSVEDDLIEMRNQVDLALKSAQQYDKDYFLFQNINEKIVVPWEHGKDKIISVGGCATA